MDDTTGFDAGAFYLAFVHPAWMVASLSMGALTLRAGLRLRAARRRGVRKNPADYRRHLMLAKPTLAMLWLGFAMGLASAFFLRGWDVLGTAHGWISTGALALFTATAVIGRRLESGRVRDPESHGMLGLAAMLTAVAAFGTGFVLLP